MGEDAVKALLIGDIHLADRPPSIRTETYPEDILTKLEAAGKIAVEQGCEAIVSAGDVFHIKTPTRTSHALVQRTAEVLTAPGLPVLIVPGNHDMSNDRIESLRKQPLGTLCKAKGIDLLVGPHPEFPLFGIPYLHDWVLLHKWLDRYKRWANENKGEDFHFWPLVVTHAPIFPPGEVPPYEYIDGAEWAALQEVGDCYYGHIHDPHGAYTPASGIPVTMCNNGAVSRGSLHEATLKREPKVTVWDSEVKPHFEAHPLPFRPVEAVFRLREKEDVDEKTSRVEEFLSSVGQTTLDGLSLEEVFHRAQEAGLRERTRSLIGEILEEV